MIRRYLLATAAAAAALAASAVPWSGLDDANHYSGPKLTAESLEGKVVLVDEWGCHCGPCKALLPRMQDIWQSFKHKPFVLLGSHRQGREEESVKELIKANKLTYPMYGRAGIAEGEPPNGGGIPFMYVVDHRGKVVYAGRDERAATEAVVNALGRIDAPPTLTGDVVFKKYKAMEKQLVLGKSIKSHVKKLEADVKKASGKAATSIQKEMGEEAEQILAAIKEAKETIKEDIAALRKSNPAKALQTAKAYVATFPEEGAELKAQLSEIAAEAKEFAAKAKEKAKAGLKK